MMHPAAALLGKALWDFARRNADEPDEQDAILDFLERFVEDSANSWDDKYLLMAFRSIRVVLDIEELPGSAYADADTVKRADESIAQVEAVVRPLRGPKSLKTEKASV